ncbi:hypothetical protein BMETH_99_0 [methanotrophic bacterial endosymbiont of Bathymodiolus sp.]|nr:hypothetical protein BMETH_99_0 [methanotrophic bacterial endosymbiont of Bathymodiolus sp.]
MPHIRHSTCRQLQYYQEGLALLCLDQSYRAQLINPLQCTDTFVSLF